jgi:hypothetical protein
MDSPGDSNVDSMRYILLLLAAKPHAVSPYRGLVEIGFHFHLEGSAFESKAEL